MFVFNANARGGTGWVTQIIFFMQENRAFDHYAGKLAGVRGFNDRVTIPLSANLGPTAFYQPVVNASNQTSYMLPFRVDMHRTSAVCMDAPDMNWFADIAMWNEGRYDRWNTARKPGFGMVHVCNFNYVLHIIHVGAPHIYTPPRVGWAGA